MGSDPIEAQQEQHHLKSGRSEAVFALNCHDLLRVQLHTATTAMIQERRCSLMDEMHWPTYSLKRNDNACDRSTETRRASVKAVSEG